MGGSNGAAQDPAAFIVPARRVMHPPANDNKAPLRWRLRRLVVYLLILALLAGVVLV